MYYRKKYIDILVNTILKDAEKSHEDNNVYVRIYCPPLTHFPQDALKSGKLSVVQIVLCIAYPKFNQIFFRLTAT